jgi:predicted nucleotidyltransferase
MKTREEYISLIKNHADEMKHQLEQKSLFLFGSISRNEQKEKAFTTSLIWQDAYLSIPCIFLSVAP